MNVGLGLLTFFPSRVGGTETYVRGLMTAFSAGLGSQTTTALTSNLSDNFAEEFRSEHLTVKRLQKYRSGSSDIGRLAAMQMARLMRSRLAREVPDQLNLIHYPVTVPVPRIVGLPSVITLADVQHHDLASMFSRAERSYRRWAYDGAARDADAVITISHFSKHRIEATLGIPAEKIHVIHHGVDPAFRPTTDRTAFPSGMPSRYLLYPAAGWPHKNHRVLVDAFRAAADPDLFLLLSGDDTLVPKELLGERVIHVGSVSKQELVSLYQYATATVIPSLYEGFGFPALEAMACGCPVAISDIPSLTEVCGDAALTFDPYDTDSLAAAIKTLATDTRLRSSLSARGLERAGKFTWNESAAKHQQVYERVCR